MPAGGVLQQLLLLTVLVQGNLLQNPGCDGGNLTGWIKGAHPNGASNEWMCSTRTGGGYITRNGFYFIGADPASTLPEASKTDAAVSIFQNVAISDAAFFASAWIYRHGDANNVKAKGRLRLELRDRTDAVICTNSTPYFEDITAENTGYVQKSLEIACSGGAPTNVVLYLDCNYNFVGKAELLWDDISLVAIPSDNTAQTTGVPAVSTTGDPAVPTTGGLVAPSTGEPVVQTTGVTGASPTKAATSTTAIANSVSMTGPPAPSTTGSSSSNAVSTTTGSVTGGSISSTGSGPQASDTAPTSSTNGAGTTTKTTADADESSSSTLSMWIIFAAIGGCVIMLVVITGLVAAKKRKVDHKTDRAAKRELEMGRSNDAENMSQGDSDVVVYGTLPEADSTPSSSSDDGSSSSAVVYASMKQFNEE